MPDKCLQHTQNGKWRPMPISNPSTRLRMTRNMPQWVVRPFAHFHFFFSFFLLCEIVYL